MPLPTEPIGSIPRPTDLLAAMKAYATGGISREQLHASEDAALRDTIDGMRRSTPDHGWR
jgi:5-methyltetrahydropteroyltriglutamate--homocysteine methyltransferase